jgi:DNA polymerase-3 subunit beta
MKIRCVKSNLEKVLSQAENFIGKNLDLEVLSCIVLESKNGYLYIESTNIDTSYSSEIPVVVELEGKVAVKADVLYKTISAIKDNEVTLELDKNILKIKSSNSKVDINTLSHEDFPSALKLENQKEDDLEKKIRISSKDFLSGLYATFYAASKTNIKPELSSIYISSKEDQIVFVATDGFRLAEKKFSYTNDSNEKFEVLLPGDSVPPIMKTLISSNDIDIDIYFYKNQIFIQTGEFIVFSRLTEGDYVDYKKLIPEDTTTSVIFLKQDFIDSLKLVNIFSNDFNQIKVIVKEKSFLLESKNTLGKNEINVPSVVVGDDLEANFNYKYIQDAFAAIATDSFECVFNPTKPMMIRPVGDKTFTYIVVPLSK